MDGSFIPGVGSGVCGALSGLDKLLLPYLPDWFLFPARFRATYAATLYVIPLLPLCGFLVNALARKTISRGASGGVATLCAAGAFLYAFLAFCSGPLAPGQEPLHGVFGTWIETDAFRCSFGLYLDALSGSLCLVVTGVGALIHLYSIGYMARDPSFAR